MVDDALAEGGIDNITAIVADVVEGDGGGDVPPCWAPRPSGTSHPSAPGPERTDANEDTLVRTPPAGDRPRRPATPRTRPATTPQPPHNGAGAPGPGRVLALVLIVGAGLGAGYAWTRSQYFVGAAEERVAIYQGLPAALPGVHLSRSTRSSRCR